MKFPFLNTKNKSTPVASSTPTSSSSNEPPPTSISSYFNLIKNEISQEIQTYRSHVIQLNQILKKRYGWLIEHADQNIKDYSLGFHKVTARELEKFLENNPLTIYSQLSEQTLLLIKENLKIMQCNKLVKKTNESEWLEFKHYSVVSQPGVTNRNQVVTLLSIPGLNLNYEQASTQKEYTVLGIKDKDDFESIKKVYSNKFKLILSSALKNKNKNLILTGLGMGVFARDDEDRMLIFKTMLDVLSKEQQNCMEINIFYSDYDGELSSKFKKELEALNVRIILGDIFAFISQHVTTEEKYAIVNPSDVEQNGQFFLKIGTEALEEMLFRNMLVPPYDVVFEIQNGQFIQVQSVHSH